MDFKCICVYVLASAVAMLTWNLEPSSGQVVVSYEKDDSELWKFQVELSQYVKSLNYSDEYDAWSYKDFAKLASLAKLFKKEKEFSNYLEKFRFAWEHGLMKLPYDPDAEKNGTELIKSKGYDSEEHYVTTVDGYILYILRVKPKKKSITRSSRLPVFLLHGLMSSSDCFINNLHNESLAFLLVDLGYDVWLGNVRGNRYSIKHQSLHPNEKKYWKWSFDEMAKYDVSVMVDYVVSQSGHDKLNFIGHSQGTTNLISAVIVKGDELASRINKFIALAPAVYSGHTKSILRLLVKTARIIQATWDLVTEGDFFAHNGIFGRIGQTYCYYGPNICWDIMYAMAGPVSSHSNRTRIPVYLSHAPAGTSTQNMVHWAQQIEAGDQFVFYDYGSPLKNYFHYRQPKPPKYDLKKFNVPTYALIGGNDWMIVPTDSETLLSALPNVKSVKIYSDFTHLDFVWGYDIKNTAYKHVVDILSEK